MSRSAAPAQLRRRELMELLQANRSLGTQELAERFGVNAMTIRRDLKKLQDSGAIVRCYGGAVPAQRISFEFAIDERRRCNLDEKRRIGQAAARQVRNGQRVFLDTGTTTLEVAKALIQQGIRCRVATSSLLVASQLWGYGNLEELVLLGGKVRPGSPDLVGPGTELMLEKLTADITFLGSDGIDPHRGSFAADIEAARVAERMAAHSQRVVIVADRTKLGRAGAALYAAAKDIDEVITDRQADRKMVAALRDRGVTVTTV
jgi:DeoR family transcriptional regulator, aga operon transcriptional repressor